MSTSNLQNQNLDKPDIYLDYSASTPVDSRVLDSMIPYFNQSYGNASGIHSQARASARAIDQARGIVARVLNCKPKEIVFTGCGTESDNLAIRGIALAAQRAGKGNHIITSPIEHDAVGHTVDQLCREFGFAKTLLPVDQYGQVNPEDLRQAIRPDTVLVSLMYANNEVGTIQPLVDLGHIAQQQDIPFHTDAVQAGAYLDLNVDRLGVNLLSLSGHKFYAPKGVGLLYVREGTFLLPQQTGGGHEWAQRAGTENVPYIVGLAAALNLVEDLRAEENTRLTSLRDRLIEGILQNISGAQLTGHPIQRLPGHASFVIPDVEANSLLMHLDMAGIFAASGSACNTGAAKPSQVLTAMGIGPDLASGALRMTLGRHTSQADIDCVIHTLPGIVGNLRNNPPSFAPMV